MNVFYPFHVDSRVRHAVRLERCCLEREQSGTSNGKRAGEVEEKRDGTGEKTQPKRLRWEQAVERKTERGGTGRGGAESPDALNT